MFDKLKALFSDRPADGAPAEFGKDDIRLAEAALLFHVVAADGKVLGSERRQMEAVLRSDFELTESEFSQLFEAARAAENEAVDLYRFTSLIKREFNREERIALVEKLWEMVFADDEMHELEDNVVWRIAQLLDVEARDRVELKQRVRDRRGS